MEKLISQIQALSGDEADLKQLHTLLSKSEEVFFKHLPALDEVLTLLDPQTHSLGVVFILAVKAVVSVDPKIFIQQCIQFFRTCSPAQIRLEPKKFKLVCAKFTEYCIQTKQAIRAVKPLKWAIMRIQPVVDHITPQHANFLQVCIVSKCYKAGVQQIEKDLYEVDAKATACAPRDVLLYFYYGAICLIAVKQWKRAINFLQQVLSAPAVVPSVIMIEAYKKFVLASLMESGSVSGLPRHATASLQRHVKAGCSAYEEFNTSYSTKSVSDLHKCALSHHDAFVKVRSIYLVNECFWRMHSPLK
eukprot:TRINITY_DN948_c0_g1_i2.p1 TRINITY_DN948_c0_g1~~TRINITY_DN948_c0_g1_i2.p1  ORF type:complete len:303 (-),score=40.48 TRINITY_DN948_c0_g1_i2:573-1481(-)